MFEFSNSKDYLASMVYRLRFLSVPRSGIYRRKLINVDFDTSTKTGLLNQRLDILYPFKLSHCPTMEQRKPLGHINIKAAQIDTHWASSEFHSGVEKITKITLLRD
jgi:hypothetical protein